MAKGRGVGVEAVRTGFGEGRIVGAKKAVELGMANGIGTLSEAYRRTLSLAKAKQASLEALLAAQVTSATLGHDAV